MKLIFIFFIFIYLFTQAVAKPIVLSKEEQEFIKNTPIVKVGMMPDFTPFSYYIKNTPVGFEHELLDIISQKNRFDF